MGLSNAIAGGIMLFSMVFVMLNFPSVIDSIVDVTNTMSDISTREDIILKTKIQIDSISAYENSTNVDFTVANTGITKLWNYEKFNVLVTYDANSDVKTDNLTFSTTCIPSTGQWCINQFIGDITDPEILNPDESIEIQTKLTNNITNNGNVTVIIITDNGITATKSSTT